MKALVLSDTQTDWDNLEQSEIMLQELLQYIEEYDPNVIIHAGDVKHTYNPSDVRVAKFWARAIRKIKEVGTGIRLIFLLGNHDRISQSRDSKNWLDVLQAMGAEVVSTPRVKTIAGIPVAFLPYAHDNEQLQTWADELIQKQATILFFHNSIAGGVYNTVGTPTTGLAYTDLHMDKYELCLGGHIHIHQRVAPNVYYIGSPFCMDWGECNQEKGMLLVEYDDLWHHKYQITRLPTAVPGWFTTDYLLEHPEVDPGAGAHIRSKVQVTSKKLLVQVRKEEARLKAMFPDAVIFVKPDVLPDEKPEFELLGNSDAEHVNAYVGNKWPDGAKSSVADCVAYLTSKLSQIAPKRAGKALRFLKIRAEWVLGFQEVEFSYDKQGFILVSGENNDWPGHSNGAGKTSLLSLLYIALFGETLKDQKNDAWANERTEEPAKVVLTLRDDRNRLVIITRTRPHGLRLEVDGKDQSSGITGKAKDQTQGMIEQITGYDKQMLKNAVYIDQTVANGFVFGGQKDRMDLIGKIQDLDRFDAALKLVTADITSNDRLMFTMQEELGKEEYNIIRYEEDIADVSVTILTDWAEKVKGCRQRLDNLINEGKDIKVVDHTAAISDLEFKYKDSNKRYVALTGRHYALDLQRVNYEQLIAEGRCVTCGAETKKLATALPLLTAELLQLKDSIAQHRKSDVQLQQRLQQLDAEQFGYHQAVTNNKNAQGLAKLNLDSLKVAAKEEETRNLAAISKQKILTEKLSAAKLNLKSLSKEIGLLDNEREVYEFAKKAFHRSGMPLYLCASLCPVLNRAADEYSELFNLSRVMVQFQVDQGEFVVNIINAVGSATIKGQSVGESAMAGVVAAFAIREVSPRTNLLILDEPGHGLDPKAAQQFARGLLQLKNRFDTILATTHSPHIAGILSGEQQWVVVKEKGISTLYEA